MSERKKAGPTVAEMYDNYYVKHAETDLAPNSRKHAFSAWELHVCPKWGGVHVTQIKAGRVDEWLQSLPHGAAVQSLAILRWICRKAVFLDHIDASPLEVKFTLPKKASKQNRSIVTSATLHDYHAAVKNTEFEPAWILCACGGLRPGESLGVTAADLDYRELDGQTFAAVPVVREAQQAGGLMIDDRTNSARLKTPKSERWAIVLEPWASRLMELRESVLARGLTYLCDDGHGNPRGVNHMRYGLRCAYKSHGLPWIQLRNLRASYATSAHHDLEIPTEDVARLMGHSRPVITWSVYERPDVDHIAATVIRSTTGHI